MVVICDSLFNVQHNKTKLRCIGLLLGWAKMRPLAQFRFWEWVIILYSVLIRDKTFVNDRTSFIFSQFEDGVTWTFALFLLIFDSSLVDWPSGGDRADQGRRTESKAPGGKVQHKDEKTPCKLSTVPHSHGHKTPSYLLTYSAQSMLDLSSSHFLLWWEIKSLTLRYFVMVNPPTRPSILFDWV